MESDQTSNSPVEPTPVASAPVVGHRIEFTGRAGDFFRIWIVNILLSVVTLGIYSAWAKVRSRRYIYGNTRVAGSTFDYHADPVKILKGRILIGLLLAAYLFGGVVSVKISIIAALVIVALLPFIIVRASIFNLANTSYRHLRFGFKAAYQDAYRTFFLNFCLVVVTLGLGYPWFFKNITSFRARNSRYGTSPFSFSSPTGDFVLAIWGAGLIYFLGAFAGGMLGAAMGKQSAFSVYFPIVWILLFAVLAMSWFRAWMMNATLGGLSLEGVRIESRVRVSTLMALYIENAFAVALTAGLATPWALMRTARYKASCVTIFASEETLARFQAMPGQAGGAVSDAAADIWDLDIGI